MTYLPAYILSLALGALTLGALTGKDKRLDAGLSFFLAAGLGLGISACICFLSLLLLGKTHPGFILTAHLLLIVILIFICRPRLDIRKILSNRLPEYSFKKLLIFFLILATLYPVWWLANQYPFGGWDAWSCWNLKSRFLFLGEENWKNLFSPMLWRSSPHYPLLLPLINVWGWIFTKNPTYLIPLINTLVFTFLMAGLVFSGTKLFVKNLMAATLGTLFILTLPFFVTLATSQYSDIVLAYYLTGGLLCLTIGLREQQRVPVILGGVFSGFLGFTKPEGLIAAFIIAVIFIFAVLRDQVIAKNFRSIAWRGFSAGFFLASLPTVIFQAKYAPANLTFINGLFSAHNPSDLLRLKIIFSFYIIELASGKWAGIWILLLTGLLLAKGACFKKHWGIIPAFLFCYGAVITGYYWVNTYFEIGWWLSVTLSRILFSLLPIVILWVIGSWGENLNR